MGVELLFLALSIAGVALRPDTKELIARSFESAVNIVKSIIANKREPTPEEVAAMKARLEAGNTEWDRILSDWK